MGDDRVMKISDNLHESLFEVIKILSEPAIIVDDNLQVITANIDFKDSFDIPKYVVRKGAKLDRVLQKNDNIKKYIENVFLKKKNDSDIIIYQKRYYNIKVSKIKMESSIAYLFLFHDVTEQELLEIRTKKFTSNVAHELKTPLAGISSIAEIIAFNDKMGEQEIRKEARYIYDEVQRLSKLVNDLLQISKFDKNPWLIKKEILDVNAVLDHVLNSLRVKLDSNNIEVIRDVHEEMIYADFDALVQIFINLIDNAIKYAKTKIRIKVSSFGNMIRVKVEDDGIGMTQIQASKVFVRFYRTDESRDKNSGGTGLGLSIVKDLVSLHDAKIIVRSKVDIGTDFIIDFPMKKEEDE